MIITTVKTSKITTDSPSLTDIVDEAIDILSERSIVVITSKIVAICEGRVVQAQNANKAELIKKESQYYIPPEQSKYNITLTITKNMLIPTAGIDESNGNGYYVLWPAHPYKTAHTIRNLLAKRFHLTDVGVCITDSKTTPMRYGTTGTSIGHAGFQALNNYIGKPDLFDKALQVTKANIADGLAAAAVATMGEGSEQTPIAVVSDIPFVTFAKKSPTPKERKELHIDIKDDMYGPLYTKTDWTRGNAK